MLEGDEDEATIENATGFLEGLKGRQILVAGAPRRCLTAAARSGVTLRPAPRPPAAERRGR